MLRAYILDNQAVARNLLGSVLTSGGHEVIGDGNHSSTNLAKMVKLQPQIVCVDIGEADKDGLALLDNLRAQLPKALQRGNPGGLADGTPAQAVEALQKLCHDLMATQHGARPRFFEQKDLGSVRSSIGELSNWSKALSMAMKTMEHPFNQGLMIEALVGQAHSALNSQHKP